MAEQLVLTQPETKPSVTEYQIHILSLDRTLGRVTITVKSNTGSIKTFMYSDNQGANMIKAINKGNFTVNSLHKQMLEKLVADGHLSGTVTGQPE